MEFWPPILPSENAFLQVGIIWGLLLGTSAWAGRELLEAGVLWIERRKRAARLLADELRERAECLE